MDEINQLREQARLLISLYERHAAELARIQRDVFAALQGVEQAHAELSQRLEEIDDEGEKWNWAG